MGPSRKRIKDDSRASYVILYQKELSHWFSPNSGWKEFWDGTHLISSFHPFSSMNQTIENTTFLTFSFLCFIIYQQLHKCYSCFDWPKWNSLLFMQNCFAHNSSTIKNLKKSSLMRGEESHMAFYPDETWYLLYFGCPPHLLLWLFIMVVLLQACFYWFLLCFGFDTHLIRSG